MKVVFDVAAGRLAIEGDGQDMIKVLEAARGLAPSISQIQIITSTRQPSERAGQPNASAEGPVGAAVSQPESAKTLRQFARSLSLNNMAERIAAIAYYVNKVEGRPSFTPKEMDGWFTMCGFQKPSQISLALFDSKRKYGYSENVSRGFWRISNQGENLILRKMEESTES